MTVPRFNSGHWEIEYETKNSAHNSGCTTCDTASETCCIQHVGQGLNNMKKLIDLDIIEPVDGPTPWINPVLVWILMPYCRTWGVGIGGISPRMKYP